MPQTRSSPLTGAGDLLPPPPPPPPPSPSPLLTLTNLASVLCGTWKEGDDTLSLLCEEDREELLRTRWLKNPWDCFPSRRHQAEGTWVVSRGSLSLCRKGIWETFP
jgi:hypothetical protein